ncbi:Zn-dependent hydrolase [Halomarina oriensis]|uniref:Hydantoinase/carbamoylase family amidase n=1 Tax=Halomarina oriensis TaxID=671145 RepID=A0A6B0GKN5_9EURY|nr:Zn-dependent hydrolase [Halomarina oriensis]MWG33353.1 hydantoinase/carbamoylase family amidase [Halomarina oriensis]
MPPRPDEFVDGDRLREDIEHNGTFGATDGDGHGRTNTTGSEANRDAREYLVSRFEAAGLAVTVDAVGNLVGYWDPPGASGAPVAAGSHLDSVPDGGRFDGPLGVYAALEAVRAMQDADCTPERPVEVVSFTEEEGTTFASGLLGSSVASGARSVDDALALTDGEGRTLDETLDAIGFRGEGRLDASEWDAWLELHVEQHTDLERAGAQAGVVTDITGITHCEATVTGEADHAGATPMGEERTDALAAASEFVLTMEEAAEARTAEDPAAVATVGSLDVSPNATNVVPGRVEMGLDVRSVEYDSMDHLCVHAREELDRLEAERRVETTFERGFDLEPTPMAERCREALAGAGEAADVETLTLHSGAAHDSMYVASVTDAGMLFAPSRDGVSHSPREWTDWGDCAAATRVLTGALADLAGVE